MTVNLILVRSKASLARTALRSMFSETQVQWDIKLDSELRKNWGWGKDYLSGQIHLEKTRSNKTQ